MSWQQVPLRALYQRIEESGRPDLPLLSVYRDHGVVPRAGREDNYNKPSDDLGRYKVVRPGDLVLNKMKTWQGSLGVSGYEGVVSPAYFVGRRTGNVDDRFMHHLLRSKPLIAEYGARSKGIRPSQWDLPWDEFAAIKVHLPPVSDQRAIADFLDAETARIDALITKKRRLIELLDERFNTWLSETLHCTEESGIERAGPWMWAPLRHVARVHGGVTLGKSYGEGSRAYPYLRVANVQDRRLDLSDVATIEVPPDVAARFLLRVGDILMLEGNGNPDNLGRGTIWNGEVDGCLHQNHVHAVRVDVTRLSPEYLDWVVRTRWARWAFTSASEQVSIATLSQGQILDLPIPIPPLDEQRRTVTRLTRHADHNNNAVRVLTRQIDLLVEHRQALITAAVTGELAVPGVAA